MSNAAADFPRPHRLTVTDYYRMAEVGILAEDARVELIDGEIVDMAPPVSSHSSKVAFLTHALVRAADTKALVFVQNPVRLSDYSAPQPDFALLRLRENGYDTQLPNRTTYYLSSKSRRRRCASTTTPRSRSMRAMAFPKCGSWTWQASGSFATALRIRAHTRSSTSRIYAPSSKWRRSATFASTSSACSRHGR